MSRRHSVDDPYKYYHPGASLHFHNVTYFITNVVLAR